MESFNVYKIEDYLLSNKCFKGDDIKNWIDEHRFSLNEDESKLAWFLHRNYYREGNESHPHGDQYYYFKRVDEMEYFMIRDRTLSPLMKDTNFCVDLKEFKRLLRTIRYMDRKIKYYSNKYDTARINEINSLLDYRVNLLNGGKPFTFKIYDNAAHYKRAQFYNIFKDKLIDLQVLMNNIEMTNTKASRP